MPASGPVGGVSGPAERSIGAVESPATTTPPGTRTAAEQSAPRREASSVRAASSRRRVLVVLLQRVDTRFLQLHRLAYGEAQRTIAGLGFEPGFDARQIGPHQPGEQRQQGQQQQRQQHPLHHADRVPAAIAGAETRTASGIAWPRGTGLGTTGGLAKKTPGRAASAEKPQKSHDGPAVDDIERVLARRGQRVAHRRAKLRSALDFCGASIESARPVISACRR